MFEHVLSIFDMIYTMFKPESAAESKNIQEMVDFRFKQPSADRLMEYMVGMRCDNPDILQRLITDKRIMQEKYHLPEKRGSLTEYDRFLRNIAKENNVEIRNKSDCGVFFKEVPSNVMGVYMQEENQIGADIDTSNAESYAEGLLVLEHELIHSLQKKYYPRMPVEIREYEAYIVGWHFDHLKDYSGLSSVLNILINTSLLHSVRYGYEQKSKKEGFEVKPEWDDPYYFLEKVDKLSPDEIEKTKLDKLE